MKISKKKSYESSSVDNIFEFQIFSDGEFKFILVKLKDRIQYSKC